MATQCCKNYICHLCIYELQTKNLHFEIACPHCKAQPLIASDVDPNTTVKRYSDSPYGTFNKNTSNQLNKWISQLQVVDEKDDIDLKMELHPDSFVVAPTEKNLHENLYATS